MLTQTLVAAVLAVASPSSAPAPKITYDEQRTDVQHPLVHQVLCKEGAGSAFRIGPREFGSVAHVTSMTGCTIDGYAITVVEQDTVHDFSIIEAGPPKLGALKVNCEGFQTSQWYWSVGYAYALPYQTDVAIYSTAFNDPNTGERLFFGGWHTVIPGMSGGPVLNSRGEVVGTVNMYHPFFGLSYSRDLKDTSLCKSNSEGSNGHDADAPSLAISY